MDSRARGDREDNLQTSNFPPRPSIEVPARQLHNAAGSHSGSSNSSEMLHNNAISKLKENMVEADCWPARLPHRSWTRRSAGMKMKIEEKS
jgi:hypothetical protein